MTFGAEDQEAYRRRRAELSGRFAEWARRERPDAEAVDVELLLDWKWGHGDGRLDHWDAVDVEEFLLGWCPRKVAAPPDRVDGIPRSVAAFVDFLAHDGLLAPGCPPSAVQRACADLAPRFRDAMAGDPRPVDAEPTTSAHALAAVLEPLDEDAAAAEVAAWAATRPSGAADLVAAATRADLDAGTVLDLLELAASVLGADVDRAADAHRDGPHGPLVTMWLLLRGAVDPASV